FFKTQLADTISPTILTAGAEPNTLAAEAQATLNCRLMPQTAPADFFNNLAALFENDESITLTIIEQPETPYPQPPAQTEDRLFKAIEAAVQKIYPDALTLAGLSPASNESEFLRRHGILAYGIGPVMGKAKEGPHQADENILEEHFLQQLELTLDIVLNLTQIKTTQTK
ncbi:MAG: peptidase dimerization domain-containing protein, partial [Elusimicrobiota bacterium]|nr:peptidase dimerization domain-containing protein [Elusimicrobiota bacterium]